MCFGHTGEEEEDGEQSSQVRVDPGGWPGQLRCGLRGSRTADRCSCGCEEDPLSLPGERGAGLEGILGPEQHPEPASQRHSPGGMHSPERRPRPAHESRLQLLAGSMYPTYMHSQHQAHQV